MDGACANDSLEVREGGRDGQLLETFCGADNADALVVGTTLWVKFTTDAQDTGTGFTAAYNRGIWAII